MGSNLGPIWLQKLIINQSKDTGDERNFASDWKDNPLDFLSVGIMPTTKGLEAWQDYTYHFVCEVQDNGLPKVVFDGYNEEKEDLFLSLQKL